MTYAASLAFLYGLQKHGVKLGLETIETVLSALGHPHRRYPVLHVAGTNGKGSTAAMAASILHAGGYRVGLYTSPHLVDFRERIRLNEDLIPEQAVADFVERIRTVMGERIEPTFFEFTTALAFDYFAEAKVDVAVVEVGMGGRFDATNIVEPVATAVTTIGLDHQEYLGRTVEAIAFEKAGIIKPRIPVVVGNVPEEAWQVLAAAARERDAPLRRWIVDFESSGDPMDGFTFRSALQTYTGLTCPLAGRHQLENAGCALAMIEDARAHLPVTEQAIRMGFHSVVWEGRLEVVDHDPLTVLDGAHNPAAAAALAQYFSERRRLAPGRKIVLVVALMRDKDREGFLRVLLPLVDDVVVTAVEMSRSATIEELLGTPVSWPPSVHRAVNAGEALTWARRLAGAGDLICVTGSLMLVGEVKALLKGSEVSLLRG